MDLKSEPWPKISDAAKEIVRKMLARDPRKRLTAEQVGGRPCERQSGRRGSSVMWSNVRQCEGVGEAEGEADGRLRNK